MSPLSMDRLESALKAALEFYACMNRADAAGLGKILAGDCVLDGPDSRLEGRDAIISFCSELISEEPKSRWEIVEALGAGHRAIIRWKRLSADAGELSRGVDIVRERSGALVEILRYLK